MWAEEGARVESQLKILARPIYSNPPIHGSRIITTILNDPILTKQVLEATHYYLRYRYTYADHLAQSFLSLVKWRQDVKEMAERIMLMRTSLVDQLKQVGSKHTWSHITDQIGMFCYSGLTAAHVVELASKHHIYLTR